LKRKPHAAPLFVAINCDTIIQRRAKFKVDTSKDNAALDTARDLSLPSSQGRELRLIFNGWCGSWSTLVSPTKSTSETATVSTAFTAAPSTTTAAIVSFSLSRFEELVDAQ
jgi:hypothetical protein